MPPLDVLIVRVAHISGRDLLDVLEPDPHSLACVQRLLAALPDSYPWISVLSADAAKDVLSTAAPKGDIYDLLLPWLGLGLLTSTGERWHKVHALLID